jgi:hypothetical protein
MLHVATADALGAMPMRLAAAAAAACAGLATSEHSGLDWQHSRIMGAVARLSSDNGA